MRVLLWMAPIGVVVLGLATWNRPARAQGTDSREVHLGAGSCAAQACHGGGSAERAEYKLWATEDRHSKAFEVLSGDLGRKMGERLGIDPQAAPECLNCHGTTGVETADTFDMADGVSCELCHGGAGEWLGPHATREWQKRGPDQKAERGLRDLTTPAKRAQACVGCHVGGLGRDISHAIMAAGHPPLVFDAAKFLRNMPPHWKDETDQRLPTWLESMRANTLAQLERIVRETADTRGWPEFAVFDCYSCHHPIYSGSVYEQHAPPGKPGDLVPELSSLRVLLVAVGNETLSGQFKDLLAATYTPGGDPQELAQLAKRMANVARTSLPRAGTNDAPYLDNLDRHLAASSRLPRTQAQQIAFAVHALAKDPTTEAFQQAWTNLDAALDERKPYDAATAAQQARALIAAAR